MRAFSFCCFVKFADGWRFGEAISWSSASGLEYSLVKSVNVIMTCWYLFTGKRNQTSVSFRVFGVYQKVRHLGNWSCPLTFIVCRMKVCREGSTSVASSFSQFFHSLSTNLLLAALSSLPELDVGFILPLPYADGFGVDVVVLLADEFWTAAYISWARLRDGGFRCWLPLHPSTSLASMPMTLLQERKNPHRREMWGAWRHTSLIPSKSVRWQDLISCFGGKMIGSAGVGVPMPVTRSSQESTWW